MDELDALRVVSVFGFPAGAACFISHDRVFRADQERSGHGMSRASGVALEFVGADRAFGRRGEVHTLSLSHFY